MNLYAVTLYRPATFKRNFKIVARRDDLSIIARVHYSHFNVLTKYATLIQWLYNYDL